MIELRAFRYRLPMRPIQLAGRAYDEREGLVLCDARTQRHWGEAAPLPRFSRESLDDVIDEWRSGRDFSLPSLRCAVDAIQQSIARADRHDRRHATADVPVNGLISGTESDVFKMARHFADRSHRTVKMKVGRQWGSVERCAQVVQDVRAMLRPDQTLRLDANRAWDLPDAVQFGKLLAAIEIEYCEEPTASPLDLESFFAETGMPYALDETLREIPDLSVFPSARALIVKPSVDGSREDIGQLRRFAIPLVFSGAFETAIGTMHVAHLAHEYSPGIPAGLDSYSWLLQDLVSPRLSMDDGCLALDALGTMQFDLLEELPR